MALEFLLIFKVGSFWFMNLPIV